MKRFFFVLAVGCSASSTPEIVQAPQTDFGKLEQRLRRQFAQTTPQATGAVVIGVYDGDKTLVVAFGDADAETTFEIGSVTKAMSGVLLADEVNRGRLSLSDEADRWLEGVHLPRRDGEAIRVEHLATFTSGLPFMPTNWIPVDQGTYTPEMWREFLGSYELSAAPGATFAYGNVGFGVLGDVLVSREATPLTKLFHDRLFAPLGMHHSWLLGERPANARVARGHDDKGQAVPLLLDKPIQAACCAVESTPNDLLTFARAALDGAPTPELRKAFDLAMTPRRHGAGNYDDRDVGLGWFVRRDDAVFVVTGLMRGYRTGVTIDRAHHVATVVLAADAAFPSEALAREARQAVLAERDAPSLPQVSSLPDGATPANVRWDSGLELVGWSAPREVARGETVTVRHYYRATRPIPADYTVFIHGDSVGDPAARVHADHAPLRPTSEWPVGAIIEDRTTLVIPADFAKGPFMLFSGFYRADRMHVLTAEASDGHDRVRGPVITVR